MNRIESRAPFRFYRNGKALVIGHAQKVLETAVNRYVVLYLATLIVLVPIDFVFLGLVAKGFFAAQVGDMLGKSGPRPRSCSICFTWWEF